MKDLIRRVLEKWCCKHEWESVMRVRHYGYDKVLFFCRRCGKLKTKRL